MMDAVWKRKAESLLSEATMTYVVVTLHAWKHGDTYHFAGQSAFHALLKHRYKIHVLFLSHADTVPNPYRVNLYLSNFKDLEDLMHAGAEAASNTSESANVFTILLFATQGLDLAIPNPYTYLNTSHVSLHDLQGHGGSTDLQSLDFKLCPQAVGHGGSVTVEFVSVSNVVAVCWRHAVA